MKDDTIVTMNALIAKANEIETAIRGGRTQVPANDVMELLTAIAALTNRLVLEDSEQRGLA